MRRGNIWLELKWLWTWTLRLIQNYIGKQVSRFLCFSSEKYGISFKKTIMTLKVMAKDTDKVIVRRPPSNPTTFFWKFSIKKRYAEISAVWSKNCKKRQTWRDLRRSQKIIWIRSGTEVTVTEEREDNNWKMEQRNAKLASLQQEEKESLTLGKMTRRF